jgi:hypothetical protein
MELVTAASDKDVIARFKFMNVAKKSVSVTGNDRIPGISWEHTADEMSWSEEERFTISSLKNRGFEANFRY